ncbi:MAG: hypothetical protein LUQ25_00215 [Methanoregulaceae archaeon]|nr:hypothetical protein [Methanoregulaceae archaeon]
MMKKAGYLERNGRMALDDEGKPCEIVEIRIDGSRFGIRVPEMRRAIRGELSVRVERLHQNWKPYLGGIAGLAHRSRSGRALNVEMIGGDAFTLSIDAVCAVLSRKERFASVFEIPGPGLRIQTRRIGSGQQQIVPDLF